MNYQIYNEDCLEGMKKIPDDSVDMILVDLPYNLTDCAWDKGVIDLPTMWTQFKRILKPCCSAVLFASGKFTHKLIASNLDWYKYKWIWIKNAPTMFVHAKNAPMRKFEEICVFSDGVINHASVSKRRMKYNPQGVVPCTILKDNEGKSSETQVRSGGDFITFNNRRKIYDQPSQLRAGGRGEKWNGICDDCASDWKRCVRKNGAHNTYGDRPSRPYTKSGANATKTQIHNPPPENTYTQTHTNYPADVLYEGGNRLHWRRNGGRFGSTIGERPSRVEGSYYLQEQTGYPSDVLSFDAEPNGKRLHPTQKPVALLEYLIKTYTDEGEVVLDATMGSGSTGVACVNTRREFIGFELEQKFFDIAQKRIAKAVAEREQSLFNLSG